MITMKSGTSRGSILMGEHSFEGLSQVISSGSHGEDLSNSPWLRKIEEKHTSFETLPRPSRYGRPTAQGEKILECYSS